MLPWLVALFFQENQISRDCFQECELNSMIHCCAHWDTFLRSSLSVSVVTLGSRTTEKSDVLSAKA